jgi:hypothetical protein
LAFSPELLEGALADLITVFEKVECIAEFTQGVEQGQQ